MKTINECIETLERYGFEDIAGDIIFHLESITEHDAGIIQMIDDMIKGREKWIASINNPDGDFNYNKGMIEIQLLTEIKNKIKENRDGLWYRTKKRTG